MKTAMVTSNTNSGVAHAVAHDDGCFILVLLFSTQWRNPKNSPNGSRLRLYRYRIGMLLDS